MFWPLATDFSRMFWESLGATPPHPSRPVYAPAGATPRRLITVQRDEPAFQAENIPAQKLIKKTRDQSPGCSGMARTAGSFRAAQPFAFGSSRWRKWRWPPASPATMRLESVGKCAAMRYRRRGWLGLPRLTASVLSAPSTNKKIQRSLQATGYLQRSTVQEDMQLGRSLTLRLRGTLPRYSPN